VCISQEQLKFYNILIPLDCSQLGHVFVIYCYMGFWFDVLVGPTVGGLDD
jgi:hypothetical protein